MRWSPLLIVLLGCCSPQREDSSRWVGPVIIGEDDRVELFALTDDVSIAASSAVALIHGHRLSWPIGGGVDMHAPLLGEVHGLCLDEAFVSQPVLAFCSGVLVDDNLVVTSGHCLAEDPVTFCRQTLLAFGYAYAGEGEPLELRADDVFACRRVLRWQTDGPDYAVIELDRPTSRAPVTLADQRVAVGDHVTVASYPSGLPLKCETGALVTVAERDAPSYIAATDTFGGSSGGPVFDESLNWAGLVKGGAPDWVAERDCTRAARSNLSQEVHQHAGSIVEALCDAGLPSPSLCGLADTCGDGRCGAAETHDACAEDCPRARCGDMVCELAERSRCPEDCSRYARVPPDWPDAPEKYLKWHPTDAPAERSTGCQFSPVLQQASHLGPAWLVLVAFLRLRRRVPSER